eukprot:scaffold30796_cov58-Attheya_sp.AAC.1
MQWYAARDIATPNYSLSPDNDVQVQIEATLRELSSNFPSTWVRGHQDNIPRDEQPWEAILNIEADHLATEARDKTSAEDTTFEQFPASKMMLYINNLPITRSTMNEVRYAWSTQRIRENMTKKFKWDPTAADGIDWRYSHRSTIMAREYYQQNFSMKLIHERLPVLGENFSASVNKVCPCCKHHNETFSHYITCPSNPINVNEIHDGLKPIYEMHEINPMLRILMNLALANEPITCYGVQDLYPINDWKPYKALIKAQEQIGWRQLHYGRYVL